MCKILGFIWRVGVFLFLGGIGLSGISSADIRSETQSRDQAIASYLNQMVVEKPTSQDRIRSLKEQLIDPHAQALLSARKEAQSRLSPIPPLPKNFGESYDYEKARSFHKKRWEKLFSQKRSEDSSSRLENALTSQGAKTQASDSKASGEGLILDGKDIPKELDFPGPSQFNSGEKKAVYLRSETKKPIKNQKKIKKKEGL